MTITLRIVDRDQLPDGGPIEFTAGTRGFDIGREQHLDWCLPDPERFVSGHHCQVRYQDGGYWLNDVSTNGTFVNGASVRVKSPYRLAHGDRLQIGNYQIMVMLDGERAEPPPASQPPFAATPPLAVNAHDIWASPPAAAAPVDRRLFVDKQRQERGVRQSDVLEQFIELPVARQQPVGPEEFRPIQASLGNLPGSSVAERGAAGMAPAGGMAGGPSAEELLALICEAAGVKPEVLTSRDPREVARELGLVLRTTTEQMTSLLQGRATAKRITKSANRTMIGAADNNAMKFTADASEALEIMFQKTRAGYLDGPASFREAFQDLHSHEKATFAAMQKALSRLTEDLTPESVEDKVSGSFGSHKGKAWELYVQRWNAKTEHRENGMLDVFFSYFSEIYDTMTKK